MTRPSDRIFGLVVILAALAYIASALQVQASFLSDPVGPKAFPIAVGIVAILCAVTMIARPDAEPEWPAVRSTLAIGIAIVVLVIYAYALKPLGFLIPTAVVAAILSYQISPSPKVSVLSGIGLSIGLFVLFRFVLGLSLFGFPRGWF
ncbi:putative tricarboxylic transport membrane protein [Loktanella sp. DSM 29012]|uniref:tripartite tricarboxylate transporter TctB family protein n=1 Tax=Loktanella sp. DSM 29012 TaxID=1881056 RepID=UPI0008D052BC|nr:tripartite tricarboxylate transporter TctB family protein [Loktanella sp. DSM 29012]SEQ58340.1 putative tricarboxylic transport membrane protein [Loktanella sp. DSM 29012]